MTSTFTLRLITFPGMTQEQAMDALMQQFNIPKEKAKVVLEHLPAKLKAGLSLQAALAATSKLRKAGAQVALLNEATGQEKEFQPENQQATPPQEASPTEESPATSEEPVVQESDDLCPNCRAKRFLGFDSCASCGIIFKKWDAFFDSGQDPSAQRS